MVYRQSIGQNPASLKKNFKIFFGGGNLEQTGAGRHRKAHEKCFRRQPFAAFTLQFQNPQRTLPAAHDDAGFVSGYCPRGSTANIRQFLFFGLFFLVGIIN
jgi:hypothetical protein